MNYRPVAVITGASRGIGRAAALAFAEHGYDCSVACLHRQAELEDTAARITAGGASCLTFTGDLGDPDVCRRLFEETDARFGRLDVLVNNAGAAHIGLFQDMSFEQCDRLLRTDLVSYLTCCRLAIPLMLRRKSGSILNLSSVWGNVGASCETVYSAAKGGVNALTRALAKELAPSGIRVNAIACGVIDTEMNQCLSGEERDALRESIPMGRFGSPEEVAEFALAIVLHAPYLTGQVISYDGGWI